MKTKALKAISVILSVMMLLSMITAVPFTVSAAESESSSVGATSGDYSYTVYYGEAEITGYSGSATDLEIPSTIGGCKVTGIGQDAFTGCTSLVNVRIPENIISIERPAFAGCTSLQSIEVDENNNYYSSEDGVLFDKDKWTLIKYPSCKEGETYFIPYDVMHIFDNAFENNVYLQSIEIHERVLSINDYAFSGCTNLESVNILNGLEYIGWYAFSGCTNLRDVVIPGSVMQIGPGAFDCSYDLTIHGGGNTIAYQYAMENGIYFIPMEEYKSEFSYIPIDYRELMITGYYGGETEVVIPETINGCEVKIIGESAFIENHDIRSVTIPETVTSIEPYAFHRCGSLRSVIIPRSVISIGDYAFSDCRGLDEIELMDGVETIGDFAFSNCNPHYRLRIPFTVSSIGYGAFSGCSYVSFFDVDHGNPYYTSENNVLYDKNKTTLIKCFDDYEFDMASIPESVTSIEAYAFSGSYDLPENIVIPKQITSIGEYAFEDCSEIRRIEIPSSVTTIGEFAFEYCYDLTICGEAGSTAEAYATENNIPFVELGTSLIGDINLDLEKVSDTSYKGTVKLNEGTYTFKINSNGVELGNGGTFTDSVYNVQYNSEWKKATTFIATGGIYRVEYDSLTNKLKVVKAPGSTAGVNLFGDINLDLKNTSGTLYTATMTLEEGTYDFRISDFGETKCFGGKYTNSIYKKQYKRYYTTATTFVSTGGKYFFRYDLATGEFTILKR